MIADALTAKLAIAFGTYFFVAGVAFFGRHGTVQALFAALKDDKPLLYVSGVATYALGVTLIIVHNRWDNVLAGAISLIAWVMALEGLALIAAPRSLLRLSSGALSPRGHRIFLAASVLLGTTMIVAGALALAR
ncbi:MAG: hypothetical protein AAFR04_13675 [Pseudomonadota bacterium]